MKNIKLWWYQKFIITTEKAKLLNLIPSHNIYGDLINIFNCRSFWADENGKMYRVAELIS